MGTALWDGDQYVTRARIRLTYAYLLLGYAVHAELS